MKLDERSCAHDVGRYLNSQRMIRWLVDLGKKKSSPVQPHHNGCGYKWGKGSLLTFFFLRDTRVFDLGFSVYILGCPQSPSPLQGLWSVTLGSACLLGGSFCHWHSIFSLYFHMLFCRIPLVHFENPFFFYNVQECPMLFPFSPLMDWQKHSYTAYIYDNLLKQSSTYSLHILT